MQHADAHFERTQPEELKRVPFTPEEFEAVPSAIEAIGWAFLVFFCGVLLIGFLGL